MAFDSTLARGGFGVPNDAPLRDYRLFFQQHASMLSRSDVGHQTTWLAEIVTAFGPNIDTFSTFSKLDEKTRQRLLEFGRAVMEKGVWDDMALGARPGLQFLIDNHLTTFLRKDQREVDAIMFQSELNHAVTRGEDAALLAIELTALGLPSTPLAMYQSHDHRTARVILSFCRLFGSAFEAIVNADDNQLDYQNVATGARLSAASRHDDTFMRFMEFHSWIAESNFWHVSGSDLFNFITQIDVGSDALDATQVQALELFSLMRGVGVVGGNQRHMDMKQALEFAVLSGYGFLPSIEVQVYGLTEQVKIINVDTGVVIDGVIRLRAVAPVLGAHPQQNTWIIGDTGQRFELVVQVPDGLTPDSIIVEYRIPQPQAGINFVNIGGAAADDADVFNIVKTLDIGGETRFVFTATKAAKWAAGERILGNCFISIGTTGKTKDALPMKVESVAVEDTAVDQSASYQVVPGRYIVGLELPPTKTPLFAQRASGTLDT